MPSSEGGFVFLESRRSRPATFPVFAGLGRARTIPSTPISQRLLRNRSIKFVGLRPSTLRSIPAALSIHYGSPRNRKQYGPGACKDVRNRQFRIEAHNGETGQPMAGDRLHDAGREWTPSFSPVLTPQGRLY